MKIELFKRKLPMCTVYAVDVGWSLVSLNFSQRVHFCLALLCYLAKCKIWDNFTTSDFVHQYLPNETRYPKSERHVTDIHSFPIWNKKAQLWLRNPRDATAFQIHPEEIHRNDDDDDDDFSLTSRRNQHSVCILRLHIAWNSIFSKWVSYSDYKYV